MQALIPIPRLPLPSCQLKLCSAKHSAKVWRFLYMAKCFGKKVIYFNSV